MQVTTIGLDLAKHVFQIHGIDAAEKIAVRRQLGRSQVIKFFEALSPCLIGMEACATAHYWARELTKLGHEVRLMPAKDVKAYVKRNKNDAADAEAICEAVRRPSMRFVRVKSAEQQGQLMQHRTRDLLMQRRTQVINALRAHMAELGIVAAQGREGTKALLAIIADDGDERLPVDARASLIVLAAQLQALQTTIGSIEKRIIARHRASEESKRVAAIPGIGILGASAITATMTDPKTAGGCPAAPPPSPHRGVAGLPPGVNHPNDSRNKATNSLARGGMNRKMTAVESLRMVLPGPSDGCRAA